MFSKTKIALAAAIVLSTGLSASAATKARDVNQSATYTMVPGYASDGSVVAIPDPDHSGQPQFTGDTNPLHS
jgi:hypothetical protein